MQSPPPPPPPPPHHPSAMEDGGVTFGRPKSPALTFCLSVSHNVTQLCIGGVVVSALYLAYINNSSGSYVQHIILCTVGYFLLMAQAILSFSPFGCASHLKYENKRIMHAIMQVVGSSMAIAGSLIRIVDLNDNLQTGHSICGFIAMILTFASLIGGVVNLIFPKMRTNLMKILHVLIGAITITFAFISIIYAFHIYYRLEGGERNANVAVILAVFAMVGTLLMAMAKIAGRILNIN